MFFTSDNCAGVHKDISARLGDLGGFVPAYGTSDLDRAVERKFCEVFEKEVAVFFVATGTAANSLALSSVQRSGGVVFCHTEAHVAKDECGAPDFFSGMRMVPVGGLESRMEIGALKAAVSVFPEDAVQHGRAAAITITQATELGTTYSLSEIEEICDVAHQRRIPVHMDGARFANALVALETTPAEMTWRRGIDMLSFGATKNGCWCAEAIIFFNPEAAADLPFLRKRAGQLFSKSRFIAAQLDAYLDDDLWMRLARHANRMADRLRSELTTVGARVAWPTSTNEVFAFLPKTKVESALARGANFFKWPIPQAVRKHAGEHETLIRLVTSFATTNEHVSELIAALRD
ncbi:threonine aldolase family protein [Sinorhizobium meliloti]|uniref:L-threonine aldolase n=1 Tax=Rhizobium meliloti TaxID=382 RepID=A0A2J0YXN1_RHIML|nr:low specificity L-threonine aldolase [Sinorhizobium meliloti]PJR13040.1 low specificity L-threonine aldolase [Sinorhizobium meliloti]